MANHDTIVALATPQGCAALFIVRVSGPRSKAIAQQWSKCQSIKPRYAYFVQIADKNHQKIDEGLLTYFAGPNSYTGEDSFEFTGHGNPVIVEQLIQLLIASQCRLASPGEFTYRAFLNNKYTLDQAEAVADVIHAQSAKATRLAFKSLSGRFAKQVVELNDQIFKLRAQVEASIDFPEDHLSIDSFKILSKPSQAWLNQIDQLLKQSKVSQCFQSGMKLAIIGPPNVGKSSLFNDLVGDDQAIVSQQAGTTRDVLKHQIVFDGLPIEILDTAGIHQTTHELELEGIKRSKQMASQADKIWLVVSCVEHEHFSVKDYLSEHDLSDCLEKVILVYNKSDLLTKKSSLSPLISVKQKTGLSQLLTQTFHQAWDAEPDFLARQRQIDALKAARSVFSDGYKAFNQQGDDAEVIFAQALRLASEHLGDILGHTDHESLLGAIFSDFCIGK
jgi:tRNA modification GTPase